LIAAADSKLSITSDLIASLGFVPLFFNCWLDEPFRRGASDWPPHKAETLLQVCRNARFSSIRGRLR